MSERSTRQFETITSLIGAAMIPSKARSTVQNKLTLANITSDAYFLYGLLTYATAAASYIIAVIITLVLIGTSSPIATIFIALLLAIAVFVVAVFIMRWGVQFVIEARIAARTSEMEEALPDFLTEVSLNLKAGQNLADALTRASNEDLGEMATIMGNVMTRVNVGYDLEDAIKTYLRNYPSEILSQAFDLILISWRKGTSTPRIIDRMVSNMKIMRNLREKIDASVANYRIFLATITVVVAPAMMALSYYVINLIRSITAEVMMVTTGSTLPFTINAVQFTDSHFIWFSILTLLIISTFSALTTQYIRSGSLRGGFRELAVYTLASLGSYGVFFAAFRVFFSLFQI